MFERNLEDNLFNLHYLLKVKTYTHGKYQEFYVNDPKRRHIHKANVSDRVIHHLLYKYLYDLLDCSFIYDSYSCRLEKGIRKAVDRLENFTRIVSRNYTRLCWVLKCDIKKFFATIDQKILFNLLKLRIKNKDTLWLLVLGSDKNFLEQFIGPIRDFLSEELKLELHPNKIILRKLDWRIDFLGYIILPHYRLPRTKTKRRIFGKLKNKINSPNFNQSLQSYLGYLSHANSYKLTQALKNHIWFWARSAA